MLEGGEEGKMEEEGKERRKRRREGENCWGEGEGGGGGDLMSFYPPTTFAVNNIGPDKSFRESFIPHQFNRNYCPQQPNPYNWQQH